MALFSLSQSSTASFTCFIIYSHIVPGKSVGVSLVFCKKAVREAEGAQVRGLQPQHPAGKGRGSGGEPRVFLGWNCGLRKLRGSGSVHSSPNARASPPASQSLLALTPPFSTHATRNTFLKPLSDHLFPP